MKIFKTLVFILCIFVPTSLVGAELYNWTDEKGVQHFSNQRPENIKNITVIQGVPDSGSQTTPVQKTTPDDADADEAKTETQSQPKAQKTQEAEAQMRPEDIDRYLGPCYVRYLKRKSPNGAQVITNANWVYQIAESLRAVVVEQWRVGDQLKICREKGFIFNMTRDASAAIVAMRVRKSSS